MIGIVVHAVAVIVFAVITAKPNQNLPDVPLPAFYFFAEGMIINLAVLGFATGIASLLMRYRYKAPSIIGLVAAAIVLVIDLLMKF